ncbi:hypothetical protein MKW94_023909 [Papaver nudicaule]|uniref:DUF4005 domain-containing protein n=1 Tax=Papaver nudicaule TaxID=74823 RepID=A0AA41S6X2_PAPNU|nr:hypothetical protein [Papaver nudicaule]
MGKSPGKWLKTVLLGKKSSRSSVSKGRDGSKAGNVKETRITATVPSADLVVSPPIVSQPASDTNHNQGGNSELDKGTTPTLQCNEAVSLPQDIENQEQALSSQGGLDVTKQYKSATKVQAAFRGYLARRAFRALRGIIRLQALVRGHLVRRQARATLRCMQGIVKLQALVRGQKVKLSDGRIEVSKKSSLRKPLDVKRSDSTGLSASMRREKTRANAFVTKYLGSSSKAMHLQLQYGPDEPNSAWAWLERWTLSRFWKPFLQPKKVVDSKSQTRQGAVHGVVTEPSRSRRVIRKAPMANADTSSTLSTSESEKPKRNLRKASAHHVDPVQEHPQSELEKVKRNLRKVSNAALESAAGQAEVEIEEPKRSLRKPSNSVSADSPNNSMSESIAEIKQVGTVPITAQFSIPVESEKPNHLMGELSSSSACEISEQPINECAEEVQDTTAVVSGQGDVEPTQELLASDVQADVLLEDHPQLELPPLENSTKDENVLVTNTELVSKEDQTSNENQKITKRRSSFPAKQENLEIGVRNSPSIPSYMAATESAKAKLRGQGSPRITNDAVEKNGFTRRHSLPSSTNAKMSSSSPRTQRVVQSNGKGASKTDRSLLTSRDGNEKVAQAEWRR